MRVERDAKQGNGIAHGALHSDRVLEDEDGDPRRHDPLGVPQHLHRDDHI